MSEKTLRTCINGHHYYKTSNCPVCPICESERTREDDFLSGLGAPARRALEGVGIVTLDALSKSSEKEILTLHGMGPASLPKLRNALAKHGLRFSK